MWLHLLLRHAHEESNLHEIKGKKPTFGIINVHRAEKNASFQINFILNWFSISHKGKKADSLSTDPSFNRIPNLLPMCLFYSSECKNLEDCILKTFAKVRGEGPQRWEACTPKTEQFVLQVTFGGAWLVRETIFHLLGSGEMHLK